MRQLDELQLFHLTCNILGPRSGENLPYILPSLLPLLSSLLAYVFSPACLFVGFAAWLCLTLYDQPSTLRGIVSQGRERLQTGAIDTDNSIWKSTPLSALVTPQAPAPLLLPKGRCAP